MTCGVPPMTQPRAPTFAALLALSVSLAVHSSADGMFDPETLLSTETVTARAGDNVTLACPGVTEHSLVLSLVWTCRGCVADKEGPDQAPPPHHVSPASFPTPQPFFPHDTLKLVELRGESATKWTKAQRLSLTTHSLHLAPVLASDSGFYECLVNNRPLPHAILHVLVQDVPDRPGRPFISSYTSRSVNISWAPPVNTHNSRILNYLIKTRVGEDGEWNDTGIFTNNHTSHHIHALQPFTVYSFRVAAINGIGQGPWSKDSYYCVTLREVPEGKPVITSAMNASSSKIRVTFKPPPASSIHGEFLGYLLVYRQRHPSLNQSPPIHEVYLRDPNIQSYTIENLTTFTQYLVSLQVMNPEGLGPSTTVAVITDEGVPTKPENVSLLWVTDSMMELSWEEPLKPNGKLEGYRIYYMQNNFTGVVTVKEPLPSMKFALPDLEAYTEYKLWLKAFTWKNEGEPSDPIVVRTDVRGPSAPRIVNVSCMADDSLFVKWERPSNFYFTIDFYYVDYRQETWLDFEEIPIQAHPQRLDHHIFLPNLTRNVMYEVRVRGGTRSLIEPDKVYKGQYSDTRKLFMEPNCERPRASLNFPRASSQITPTMVAISICASFALFLLVVLLVIWRRCFQGEYYYLDDPPRTAGNLSGLGWEGDSGDSDLGRHSIPSHLFPKHVLELHADSDIGFSKEYEAIQAAFVQDEFAAEFSQLAENKQKNRYLNIVAYDHSRVRLQPLPGHKKSVEYVNANYIDGFLKAQAYIGTQGPLPSTFDTFWRMVWDHKVHIIVMITNLVERGRKKCDMYWPSEGTESYGLIQVKFLNETVMATYTVRAFSVRHVKLKKKKKHESSERIIYHYHYTNWPDHGTPSHPLPVLSYVNKSSDANPPDGGPIIVHCSAGVGRTGTYIVLDAMLRQIRQRGDLNVFSFLNHIRAQRNFLVQTEEQYIFIHDSLVEAIESGQTNVDKKYLRLYVHNLLSTTYTDDTSQVSSLLERQYKLVTQFKPEEFHMGAALKACNAGKNRKAGCVPSDAFRVLLTPKPGVEGSDYINASFLPGFEKLQEFVITQHPIQSTISELWQMLWDHNIQTVVVLSAVDDAEFPAFWPTSGDHFLDLETNCRVKLLQECDRVGFVLRDFSIQSLHDDYELSVKIIQASHWPHHTSHPPSSPFDLIHLVQDSLQHSHTGPIAVVDRFGGPEAATFCALTTLSKQLNLEHHVDVYMYAKLYHQQRPGVWNTIDDYLFLYRSIESLCAASGSCGSLGGTEAPTASPQSAAPKSSATPSTSSVDSFTPQHVDSVEEHLVTPLPTSVRDKSSSSSSSVASSSVSSTPSPRSPCPSFHSNTNGSPKGVLDVQHQNGHCGSGDTQVDARDSPIQPV